MTGRNDCLLEDLSMQIEEICEEFLSVMDNLEDMIIEMIWTGYRMNKCSLLPPMSLTRDTVLFI